jgi:hypothetical protein
MTYSTSLFINETGFGLIAGVNQTLDYGIGLGIMITVATLLFLWMRQTYGDVQEAFFISMTIAAFVSLLLLLMHFITWYMFFAMVVIDGLAIFFHLGRGTSTNA